MPRGGGRALVLAVVVGACFGCGDDVATAGSPRCGEDDEVRTVSVPDVSRQGSVTIRDVVDTSWDDDDRPRDLQQGRIVASFGEITSEGSPPALLTLSRDCVGVTSLAGLGTSTTMSAGTVTIAGVAGGPFSVESNDAYLGDPLLTDAEATLSLNAPGDGFAGFTTDIAAVAPLALSEPPTDGTGLLRTGEFRLEWTPGSGDFIEVRVTPVFEETTETPRPVICQIADEGCFTLPAAVTSFLLSDNAATYRLSLKRTNSKVVEPEPDTAVRVSVISELVVTLQNGVFQ